MTRWRGPIILLTLLLAAPARAGGRLVLVVGAEGEAEYGRQFATWADRWVTAAAAGGLTVERIGPGIRALATSSASRSHGTTGPAATMPATQAASDKDRLHAALDAADGPLWLVLIGHGTAGGADAGGKFNLVGPDVSDRELAAWLKPTRGPVAVIVCASGSGSFVNRLSARGRVVMTAARSGEQQFSRFGDALSAAVVDPAADLDKDGQTSLLEAFLAASKRTDAFYAQAGRLATEHALLDGDGAGVGADWFRGTRAVRAAANGAAVDGGEARRWCLVPVSQTPLSPERQVRRDTLEAGVETLRREKAKLSDADYYARLEGLLTEMARLYE